MAARVDFVAITLHNTSPVAISRVIDEGGLVCFGACELYDKHVASTVSWPTWRDDLKGECLLCQRCFSKCDSCCHLALVLALST